MAVIEKLVLLNLASDSKNEEIGNQYSFVVASTRPKASIHEFKFPKYFRSSFVFRRFTSSSKIHSSLMMIGKWRFLCPHPLVTKALHSAVHSVSACIDSENPEFCHISYLLQLRVLGFLFSYTKRHQTLNPILTHFS